MIGRMHHLVGVKRHTLHVDPNPPFAVFPSQTPVAPECHCSHWFIARFKWNGQRAGQQTVRVQWECPVKKESSCFLREHIPELVVVDVSSVSLCRG